MKKIAGKPFHMARFPACWPGLRITWQFGKLERGTIYPMLILRIFFSRRLRAAAFFFLRMTLGFS